MILSQSLYIFVQSTRSQISSLKKSKDKILLNFQPRDRVAMFFV